MSEIKGSQKADFFGKDGLSTFVGTVEDVNDPKGAARVKVRCVGWHPKDKEELKTEDLPWMRVSAPTTHAQQARVGSKHGLLPGCWVWGFFLDNEQQDGMVSGSFPFTARALEEDSRDHDIDEKIGTQDDSKRGFPKDHTNVRGPNVGTQTKDEQGTDKKHKAPNDPSGDAPALSDAKSLECGENRSASNEAKEAEFRQTSNAGSQNRKFFLADGGCGNVPHLTADTQKLIQEFLPSEFDRFKFGDQVWSKYTGAFMNINGILGQIGLDITGKARISINQSKAFQEDTINRTLRAGLLNIFTDRDAVATITTDEKSTVQQDVFHTTFSGLLSNLSSQVTGMLKELDTQGIMDTGSIDIASSIVGNIENIMNDSFDEAFTTAENFVEDLGMQEEKAEERVHEEEEVTEQAVAAFTIADFASRVVSLREAIQAEADKAEEEKQKKEEQNSKAQDVLSGLFGSALSQVGSIDSIMSFSMLDKYSLMGAKSHNRTGDETQDERTKKGSCRDEREYGTVLGALAFGKGQGSSGGSQGDGSQDGDSKKNETQVNKLKDIDFGGRRRGDTPDYNNKLSDNAKKRKLRGKELLNIESEFWETVGILIPNEVERLRGELSFITNSPGVATKGGDKLTKNSRVILVNQTNASENGVWITSSRDWTRAEDANKSEHFKAGKRISDQTYVYEYIGKSNPTIDYDDLLFKRVGSVAEITREELTNESFPSGNNAKAVVIGLPSSDKDKAKKYDEGAPNSVIIKNKGEDYHHKNKLEPKKAFPSIYIRGYNGTPVPVVDEKTGEMVAVMTNLNSFNPEIPSPSLTIIPDSSELGLTTSDPDYDFVLGGVFVANTGFGYTNPEIKVIDADTGKENGEVKVRLVENRIVEVEIINNGTGYKRLPEIKLKDSLGYGAKLMPIINVVPKPQAKPLPIPVEAIFCPAKNNVNNI